MNTLELKGSLLEKVSRIEDVDFLEHLNGLAKNHIEDENHWDGRTAEYNLSPEQEAELAVSVEETYHEENLIDHETVMQKYAQWLRK